MNFRGAFLQVVNRLLQYQPSTNSLPDQRRELKVTGSRAESTGYQSGIKQEAAEKLRNQLYYLYFQPSIIRVILEKDQPDAHFISLIIPIKLSSVGRVAKSI